MIWASCSVLILSIRQANVVDFPPPAGQGDEHHSLVGVGKFHHSIRDHQFTWLWQSECDDSDDGGVRATLFISADTES